MKETQSAYAADNGVLLLPATEGGVIPYFPAQAIIEWLRANKNDRAADILAEKVLDAKIQYVDHKKV